jgi:hypothetical protein
MASNLDSPVAVSSGLPATVSDPIQVPVSEIQRATRKHPFAKLESSPDVGTSGLQLTVSHPIKIPASGIDRATQKRPFAQMASNPTSLNAGTSGLHPIPDPASGFANPVTSPHPKRAKHRRYHIF